MILGLLCLSVCLSASYLSLDCILDLKGSVQREEVPVGEITQEKADVKDVMLGHEKTIATESN